MNPHIEYWETYRDSRAGTYEFRSMTRYRGVAERLAALGFDTYASVMDVGAGTCQFARYLREHAWCGPYMPVDAVIDGADLSKWIPSFMADYAVCIETLEHIHNPGRLLGMLRHAARKGIVITTPNPDVVDVLRCDPTHVSVITPGFLESQGYVVTARSFFGVPNDTLVAWRKF
jgi:hypothetical protein